MQTSINAADDEDVVRLAAKAGCMFVFVGFETINNSDPYFTTEFQLHKKEHIE